MGSNACNDKAFTQLDLSSFSRVRAFEVGEYSFAFVQEVRMIGLSQLERVAIGSNCFAASEEDGSPFSGRFCLKNCERVKELRIDSHSFVSYTLCEIESLPLLEVIHFGELDAYYPMFISALLNLISCFLRERLRNRLAQAKVAGDWQLCLLELSSCDVPECVSEGSMTNRLACVERIAYGYSRAGVLPSLHLSGFGLESGVMKRCAFPHGRGSFLWLQNRQHCRSWKSFFLLPLTPRCWCHCQSRSVASLFPHPFLKKTPHSASHATNREHNTLNRKGQKLEETRHPSTDNALGFASRSPLSLRRFRNDRFSPRGSVLKQQMHPHVVGVNLTVLVGIGTNRGSVRHRVE